MGWNTKPIACRLGRANFLSKTLLISPRKSQSYEIAQCLLHTEAACRIISQAKSTGWYLVVVHGESAVREGEGGGAPIGGISRSLPVTSVTNGYYIRASDLIRSVSEAFG